MPPDAEGLAYTAEPGSPLDMKEPRSVDEPSLGKERQGSEEEQLPLPGKWAQKQKQAGLWQRVLAGHDAGGAQANETKRAMQSRHLMMIGECGLGGAGLALTFGRCAAVRWQRLGALLGRGCS